ncbi:hypothetical protein Spea_2087 [Shewanella pealeana ATCC 700345]|uniref:Uncharacterized protein n=1 Tax=Shewanella pealeana (strain ATCC 700345 / ANG-SQ1) TaxID=398579 RepID=A8H4C0_SHEPA|nr:hypothetical protein Spea_2087 [Shewanella pealeana ATCC 700345]
MALSKVLVYLSLICSFRSVFFVLLALCSASTMPANTLDTANSELLAKSRYSAGLVCQDKGWEFCARWAQFRRSPSSRIA